MGTGEAVCGSACLDRFAGFVEIVETAGGGDGGWEVGWRGTGGGGRWGAEEPEEEVDVVAGFGEEGGGGCGFFSPVASVNLC